MNVDSLIKNTHAKLVKFFDYKFYRKHYMFSDKYSEEECLLHYLKYSSLLPYSPCNKFSSIKYIERYPDIAEGLVAKNVKNLLWHYIEHGKNENRVSDEMDASCKNKHSQYLNINTINSNIAFVIHVYYDDFVDIFGELLSSYSFKFDLFITGTNKTTIKKYKEKIIFNNKESMLYSKICKNQGRNFGPFLVSFSDVLTNYDFIAHVHTKKSLYTGKAKYDVALNAISGVLGCPEYVNYIISLFNSNSELGLIYSQTSNNLPYWANHWLGNFNIAKKLSNIFNVEIENGFIDYPVGGMFWARVDAIKELLNYNWRYDFFPEESGQIDGTEHHALERFISAYIHKKGYKSLLWNNYCADFVDSSTYYKRIEDNLKEQKIEDIIDNHDIISFDIFDTLIIRDIRPSRLRKLLDQKYNRYSIVRNEAEYSIRNKLHEEVNLFQIIDQFCVMNNISFAEGLNMFNEEFALEKKHIHKRNKMISFVRYAKNKGKRIIYVSDMYYSEPYIKNILEYAEVPLPDMFYISSDLKKRKDTGEIWNIVHKRERGSIVHFGDNIISDVQRAQENNISSVYVPSIEEKCKMLNILFRNPNDNEYEILFPIIKRFGDNPFFC